MRFILAFLLLFTLGNVQAQGRRLPDFSFVENTDLFADANRAYNDQSQYTDTLFDDRILKALLQIMVENPELVIEIVGHTSMNEDTLIGQSRADTVRNYLLANAVDSHRVYTLNLGYKSPVISEAIIESLPSAIEVEAAHQKNRRAVVRIVGVKREE